MGTLVYPHTLEQHYLYAEDIEEAIIQYLIKVGVNENELRESRFSFELQGKWVPTDTLRIQWR